MFMVEEYDEFGILNIADRSIIGFPINMDMYRNRIHEIEQEIQQLEDFIALDRNKYEDLYLSEIQDRQRRIENLRRHMDFLYGSYSFF